MTNEPKTLQEAVIYFSDPDNCVNFLISRRWPDGVVRCPRCQSEKVTYMQSRRVWQCRARHAKAQFSIKVGTIFEDSALGLDKWLTAMWMIANCKNGVSSHEIAASLGITQKSAWHLLHRIRLVMRNHEFGSKLGNNDGGSGVETDETFIGGTLKNMHKDRAANIQRTFDRDNSNPDQAVYYKGNKTPVIGMFDRDSRQVRAKVVPNVRRDTLQKEILKNVKHGSNVFTDEAVVYDTLRRRYIHETVNHAETYVKGNVHTNSLENFWSLVKRNLAGTYVAVEPFHLDRYLDEQVFRFNHRINHTAQTRFNKMISQIVGRQLTYAKLTGKEDKKQLPPF
jgi:hypothetical protein